MSKHVVLLLCLALGVLAPSCSKKKGKAKAQGQAAVSALHWKGVIMTGDDSIVAFDNARERLKELWQERGVAAADIRDLSMKRGDASKPALAKALKSLKVGKGDACMVHLTSHGSPWGFFLRGQGMLTPAELDKMLAAACGEQPTVVMVSACYSGVFNSNAMKRPNRTILTAARDDRNSFGCGVEDTYTFWDSCVIEALPRARTAAGLARDVGSCIRGKEKDRKLAFSYPQAFVGSSMARLPLFDAKPLEAE
jgi:hypothetical protein